jgi:hypothetical protein
MTDTVLRLLIGGLAVSFFAALADVVRPKSFAGLFGAAPSIALATLTLTVSERGASFAAAEGRSMMRALWRSQPTAGRFVFCCNVAACTRPRPHCLASPFGL